MFNPAAKPPWGLNVRKKSQWTAGGIVLWLIAAILATLIVCTRIEPDPEPPSASGEVELEIIE
jgi:hypothetical protein